MAAAMKNNILICMLMSFLSFVRADDGSATFYTQQNPSACRGFETPTEMVASASAGIYRGGEGCDLRFRVSCTDGTNLGTPHPCTGQSVVVQVVDFCKDCRATFDLSQDAFAAIANTDAGKVLIQYEQL